MDQVTYHHVELQQHDVVYAEGPPAESYLDVGDRANFANAEGPLRLFPDFSNRPFDVASSWEAKGCAPLMIVGPEVEAVRRRIATRRQASRAEAVLRQRQDRLGASLAPPSTTIVSTVM